MCALSRYFFFTRRVDPQFLFLYVGGLGDVVREERGVTKVVGVLFVLTLLAPGANDVGVPVRRIRGSVRAGWGGGVFTIHFFMRIKASHKIKSRKEAEAGVTQSHLIIPIGLSHQCSSLLAWRIGACASRICAFGLERARTVTHWYSTTVSIVRNANLNQSVGRHSKAS